MKVLFVFNHPAPYKVELLSLIAHEVDLTVLFERRRNRDRDPLFYHEHPDLNAQYLSGWSLGKENHLSCSLKQHLKTHHYDRIVMNGYSTWTEMIALSYLIKKQIPYDLYVNGGVIRHDRPWKRKLKQKWISHAERYYSPSIVADEYLVHYGADPAHILHYPYATIHESEIVSQPLSPIEKMAIRQQYGLPLEGPLFISAGQFIPRKNNEALFPYFTGEHHRTLVLCGSGPEHKKYQKWLKNHPDASVCLLDFLPRESLFRLFQAADVYITLSKEDIYGHTINEALSQGLPVIASDQVVAAKTLIQSPKVGRIVSLDQPEMIEQAMEEVLSTHSFAHSIQIARENTYEKSAAVHLKWWKGETQ